ncbi:uncharacterized protein LOC116127509 [Pistacia vera]|uniref:uncharacterized protein LOC116127509 n=1 Tax=Pistacia vera TaxID=55513 RepID=UPI001262F8E8|nr:uncharacterized protein LOC116127509 [Pistacia vera]
MASRPAKVRKEEEITLSEKDVVRLHHPHKDALVIAVEIDWCEVHRMLVDNRSAVNIPFQQAFEEIQWDEVGLKLASIALSDFSRDHLIPKGTIALLVILGETHEVTKMIKFLTKFSTPMGCREVKGSQRESRDCYVRVVQMTCKGKGKLVGVPEQAMTINRIEPQLGPVEDNIDPHVQEEYSYSGPVETLSEPNIICHALNIDGEVKPVCQKKRAIDLERYAALKIEVDKLLSIGFIRKTRYPSWVTNPVLVKKPNSKW